MSIVIGLSTVLFGIVCVLLIIIVLLQSDKGAGMGILGGASSQSTFGSSTADIITKITTVLVALFLVGSLGLSIMESWKERALESEIIKQDPKPASNLEKDGNAVQKNPLLDPKKIDPKKDIKDTKKEDKPAAADKKDKK